MTFAGRQDWQQTDSLTNVGPSRAWTINFRANSFWVYNTTPFNCYINVGSREIPTALGFNRVIAPYTSIAVDPAGARDFAVNIDNSANPGQAFTLPVVVGWSTGQADAQAAIQTVGIGGIVGVLSFCVASTNIQSLAGGTTATVPIITIEDQPTGNPNYSLSGSGVKLANAGRYLVVIEVDASGFATLTNYAVLLNKNGSLIASLTMESGRASDTISALITERFAANDIVSVGFFNSSGLAVTGAQIRVTVLQVNN